MKPIPENARPEDPRWTIAFLDLAQGLVMAGAKAKIIERFTNLSHRRVRAMYKALRGIAAPAGPVMQGSARYFAIPSKRTSTAWSIQCAIFLACYERMGKITTTPVQRGWLLLAAFNSYLSLTEELTQTTPIKRLDINQAYALLTYCGFMMLPAVRSCSAGECPICSIHYPVVANEVRDTQPCPVCTLNANCVRFSAQDYPAEGPGTAPRTPNNDADSLATLPTPSKSVRVGRSTESLKTRKSVHGRTHRKTFRNEAPGFSRRVEPARGCSSKPITHPNRGAGERVRRGNRLVHTQLNMLAGRVLVEELNAMVATIGIEREWFHNHGTSHSDFRENKEAVATRAGAVQIERRQVVELIGKPRDGNEYPQ